MSMCPMPCRRDGVSAWLNGVLTCSMHVDTGSRGEGERAAVGKLGPACSAVRMLDGGGNNAMGRKRTEEVASHVHVATEAMRVDEER